MRRNRKRSNLPRLAAFSMHRATPSRRLQALNEQYWNLTPYSLILFLFDLLFVICYLFDPLFPRRYPLWSTLAKRNPTHDRPTKVRSNTRVTKCAVARVAKCTRCKKKNANHQRITESASSSAKTKFHSLLPRANELISKPDKEKATLAITQVEVLQIFWKNHVISYS
jgi:hypothetical protein